MLLDFLVKAHGGVGEYGACSERRLGLTEVKTLPATLSGLTCLLQETFFLNVSSCFEPASAQPEAPELLH